MIFHLGKNLKSLKISLSHKHRKSRIHNKHFITEFLQNSFPKWKKELSSSLHSSLVVFWSQSPTITLLIKENKSVSLTPTAAPTQSPASQYFPAERNVFGTCTSGSEHVLLEISLKAAHEAGTGLNIANMVAGYNLLDLACGCYLVQSINGKTLLYYNKATSN